MRKSVPGKNYGTPKEIWGFRTAPRGATPEAIARQFIASKAALFKLDLDKATLKLRRTIKSRGATHVIIEQRHLGRRIHRAYITVHVDDAGRVYFAKNRSVPQSLLPARFDCRVSSEEALARARQSLPQPRRQAKVRKPEAIWYPVAARVVPAWKVRIVRERPAEDWIIYVNARTGGLLRKQDNAANARATAWVFDPNPATTLGGHQALLGPNGYARQPPEEAYTQVTLRDLGRSGYLSGPRVTTSPTRSGRVRRPNGQFLMRAGDPGFEEVMVYHHIDSAVRYLERLGYKGNRAIFREPVRVNVNGTREDNSEYNPDDKLLTFGTGWIDDAEDGETILHEFGHAIQDAICPNFGMSNEGAAMGEGFGDYFAASFFESRKPERYKATVMSWDGLYMGLEAKEDPPCLRRVDTAATFRDFRDRINLEHKNGLIWSATLWDIRNALGRAAADSLIVEGHFQLDPHTTMARGARAIMDADSNLHRGRHRQQLADIFRKRRIGPL